MKCLTLNFIYTFGAFLSLTFQAEELESVKSEKNQKQTPFGDFGQQYKYKFDFNQQLCNKGIKYKMSKILKKQTSQKPYKQIILDRLNKEIQKSHKKTNNINSLKTQCTPNDKTQQIYEKVFQQFDDAVKLKYKPVPTLRNKKPIKRSMYMELLQIQKNGLSKPKSKLVESKQGKRKCFTQTTQKTNEKQKFQKDLNLNIKGKKSGKITRENTCKKSLNGQKSKIKEQTFTLKRQVSSTNFPVTFKRSQSLQFLSLASKVSPNVESVNKKESRSKKVLSPYRKKEITKIRNIY